MSASPSPVVSSTTSNPPVAVAAAAPTKKSKNIDWDRRREEQLVHLVVRYKAYKKTERTMEEKWIFIQRELFTYDNFKDYEPLDGYTLQKKFLRLKRKIASKYDITNPDFDVATLPEYADDLERLMCKIIVETLAIKNEKMNISGAELNDGDMDVSGADISGVLNGSRFSRKSVEDSDSEAEDALQQHQASVGVDDMDITLSPVQVADAATASSGRRSDLKRKSTSNHGHNNTNNNDLLADYEREKERRRIESGLTAASFERLEVLRIELENKEKMLRLETEAKQAEAQIKLAEAQKAQAEVTFALLQELQKWREERDQFMGTKEKK